MGKIYIGDTLISITPGSTEAEAAYTKAQSDQKITDLIDGAPDTLNTLNEIAEGIGNLKLDSLADVEIKDGKVGTIDTISGGTQVVDGTYTGVGSASSGSGTGATFNVVVASGSVGSITVNNAGSGYIIDETLSITEESLGYNGSGGTGSDPVTFDVATLADAGIMIYDATAAGTKADPHFINKTLSEIGIITSASPVFTGDFTVDENANGTTFFVDSTNDRVGIGTKVPGAKLVVIGDTKLNGDLSVDTNELFVDSTNSRVGIGTATPTAGHNLTVAGSSLFNHNILLPGVSKGFTKQNCYYKTGGIRLQKAASANDEVTLRYNGATSNDFIIQQQYNNAAAGKITLVGTLPAGNANVGETAIRLDAQVIDVGFTNVNLINLKGDTEVGSNKSVIFKDSRDATDGLQFFHTGVRAAAGEAGRDAIQMGMYGNSGDADYGKFKITHKVGSATNTDVLSVSNGGGNITIHKPTQFTNGISGTLSTAAQGNITSVGTLTTATVSGDLSVDTDTLKVDATNDRVGINKAVPTAALDVNGSIVCNGTVTCSNMLDVSGDAEFTGSVLFDQSVEFVDEVDFSGGNVIGLVDLNIDGTLLSVDGSLNKVGINHTPVSGSNTLHVNGGLTVESGGEKGLFIQPGNYEYKIGDIDAGDVGTYLEINSNTGKSIFHNCNLGINKTPTSGIELDVNGDAFISGTITSEGSLIIQGDFESETTLDLVGGSGISATDTIQTTGAIQPGVYADAAARDAAIGSPQAGMMVFVTSGTKFQGYTGAAWVDLN